MSSKKAVFHGDIGQVVMGNVLIGKNQEGDLPRLPGSFPFDCRYCKVLAANRRLQRFVVLQALAILILIALAIWLHFFHNPTHAADDPTVCYMSGDQYSHGSTVKMPSGEYRICHRHPNRRHAEWLPAVITVNTP